MNRERDLEVDKKSDGSRGMFATIERRDHWSTNFVNIDFLHQLEGY